MAILVILSYFLTRVYIRIFQGKASNKVRMIFGTIALSNILAGSFILFGNYKDINK